MTQRVASINNGAFEEWGSTFDELLVGHSTKTNHRCIDMHEERPAPFLGTKQEVGSDAVVVKSIAIMHCGSVPQRYIASWRQICAAFTE